MKRAIAVTLGVAAVLVAANMLGVADAEAPTTTTGAPVPTVSVEGVANVPIPQSASLAVATGVYREGMAAALADGHGKAEFLAGRAGVTLAGVQSIAEDGGSIECTGGGEEGGYVSYEGEQPDFGSYVSRVQSAVAPEAAASPVLKTNKKKKKKRKGSSPSARKASSAGCTLSAQVSLVYAVN
jgi:hypothetical protein